MKIIMINFSPSWKKIKEANFQKTEIQRTDVRKNHFADVIQERRNIKPKEQWLNSVKNVIGSPTQQEAQGTELYKYNISFD